MPENVTETDNDIVAHAIMSRQIHAMMSPIKFSPKQTLGN